MQVCPKTMLEFEQRFATEEWLIGTHQGKPSASHLSYYLDEFVFRFNRRTSRSRGLFFYRLLEQAVNIDPIKDQDIRGGLSACHAQADWY